MVFSTLLAGADSSGCAMPCFSKHLSSAVSDPGPIAARLAPHAANTPAETTVTALAPISRQVVNRGIMRTPRWASEAPWSWFGPLAVC